MIAASVIASILLSSTVATKIFDEDFKTAALDSKIVDAINVTTICDNNYFLNDRSLIIAIFFNICILFLDLEPANYLEG